MAAGPMPELPEVELVVRDLEHEVVGCAVEGVELIWPGYLEGIEPENFAKRLIGQDFRGAERIGKFILLRLDAAALLVHLRMTGKILKLPPGCEAPPHTHVLLRLDDGSRLAFSDIRKFGRLRVVTVEEIAQVIASLGLGIEPLDRSFAGGRLRELFRGRRRSIKSALLDQSLVAGIGNIYACEILFAASIGPARPAGSLSRGELTCLVRAARRILKAAIDLGGASLRDYRHLDGGGGRMQNSFKVYARESEPCHRCGGTIRRIVQSGRGTFWCPCCQV